MQENWSTQIATDDRDGIACELVDVRGESVAEVFACDTKQTVAVTVNGAERNVPQDILDWFLAVAEGRIVGFDSGMPLPPRSKWPIRKK